MKALKSIPFLCLAAMLSVCAQEARGQDGIPLGPLVLRPSIDLEAGYDDRATVNRTTGDSTDSFYSQWGIGAQLSNDAARYGLSAEGQYGYRYYTDDSSLDDDFYNLRAGLASDENPLKWGLSSSVRKSLSYNTAVNTETGEGPSDILTDNTSHNYTAEGNVSYEKNLSDRTALSPYVGATYFFEDFDSDEDDAKWQTYSVGCELAFLYSEKTLFSLVGDYSLQVGDDDDGSVVSVAVGTRSRVTDKISWNAEIGYSFVDYDESGSDGGILLRSRVLWDMTEKVTTYVFAGHEYQPGYNDGGARSVYRAGYGVNWQISSRWSASGQGLHDYEDAISGDSSDAYGSGVKHFYTVSTSHSLTDRASVSCGVNFVNDEYPDNQLLYFVRLSAAL